VGPRSSCWIRRAPTISQGCLRRVRLPANRGVIHCWSLDIPDNSSLTDASVGSAQVLGCASAIHLVQSLCRRENRRSGCAVAGHARRHRRLDRTAGSCPLPSSVVGVGQSHHDRASRTSLRPVDLDPRSSFGTMRRQLAEEIWGRARGRRGGLRRGVRYAPRLTRCASVDRLPGGLSEIPHHPNPSTGDHQAGHARQPVFCSRRCAVADAEGGNRGRGNRINFRDVFELPWHVTPAMPAPWAWSARHRRSIGEGVKGFRSATKSWAWRQAASADSSPPTPPSCAQASGMTSRGRHHPDHVPYRLLFLAPLVHMSAGRPGF